MARSDKKQIVVSKFGDSNMFTIKDKNDEILYECIEPFRRWGIDRCAQWIKRYNENLEKEEVEDAKSE